MYDKYFYDREHGLYLKQEDYKHTHVKERELNKLDQDRGR
jgi:hypothetical protein